MTPTFLLLAGLAVGIAVLFVIIPLLRSQSPEHARLERELEELDDQIEALEASEYATRRKALKQELAQLNQARNVPLAVVLVLAVGVPLGTALLYTQVGEPDGLTPTHTGVAELRGELIRIANRLERDPDNFEEWARLGMAYKAIEEFSSAAHALRRALYIDDRNPFIKVELAETLMFASRDRRMPAESRSLLEEAVAVEPNNQKALWLLGVAAYQLSAYQDALSWWQRLDNLLEDGSVRQSVREQMQAARIGLGLAQSGGLPADHPSRTPEAPADRSPPAPETQPSFRVQLRLDEALSSQVSGDETVFLTARAADGPAAPLAVVRLRAGDLPATVELSDANAMVEGLNLSTFPVIQLTARVAFGGGTDALPGDLIGRSATLSILESAGTELVIDQVVED
ncbi:MAG: c-type cytochrome biogenesis protein CcmI/CycH [Wenzhouxiangella sp.]